MKTTPKQKKAIRTITETYFKNKQGEQYALTDGQADIFATVTRKGIHWVWMSAPTRYGKLIADNVPVLTTKGWKNHGDLMVGDYVFNHKGKPTKVIGVAPKDIADIEVSFSNGEKIKVNEDHKWLVQHKKWKGWKVVDTKYLMNRKLKWKDGHRVFRMPKIKPLQFSEKKLPIDPYTLGAWLGDGVTTAPCITIQPSDRVIINNIPYKVSKEHKHKVTGIVRYDFYKTELLKGLKKLDLITHSSGGWYKQKYGYFGKGKKFIPDIYKHASIKQKVELLAGLVDTDGYVHSQKRNGWKDGRVKIINTNKQLIDDCADIVRSLGMRVNITKVKAGTSSSGIVGKKDVYYLGFDAEMEIPTVLPRKKIIPRIKNKYVCIDKIERVKPEQGNCIKVENDDGIYLVGKKLIPTHNTEILALALLYLAVFENLKIPIVAGSEDKARKIMEYILQHIPDHPELHAGLLNMKGLDDADKLKVSASKDTLRWATGGWIYVTSINSRQKAAEGEGVVGEGGDVVVLEEAGLIREKDQFSKIVRMAEGDWRKLVMSGNCVENSIFEDAFHQDLYDKVHIGLEQSVEEGRYTWKELEEKKPQITSKDWKRYFEVKFPDANEYAYFKPKTYEKLPDMKEIYGAVDLALGESKKGSLTGITVIGKDVGGQFYELENIGEKLTPDETIVRIFNLPYTFTRFGIEAVQFQRYFLKVIDRQSKAEGRYIPFVGVEQKRKKEERIESLEPVINTGQILFSGRGIIMTHMKDYPECELDVLDSLEMSARIAGLIKEQFIGFF